MRIALVFAYDGTEFYGFESQKGLRTVQGELNAALASLYGASIATTPSGRTDAGVHALAQVVHYETEKDIPVGRIAGALNFYLPLQIRVKSARIVSDRFNARKSAKKKTYRYDMYVSRVENPLLANRAHRLVSAPDMKTMQAAASLFIGTHDFTQFSCVGSSIKTTVRTVYDCRLSLAESHNETIIRLTISANGFLYKMVRLIASAIIKAGQNKLSLTALQEHINNTAKPPLVKTTAPAGGLYLESVEYNPAQEYQEYENDAQDEA